MARQGHGKRIDEGNPDPTWGDGPYLDLGAAIIHQAVKDLEGRDGCPDDRKLDALFWLVSPAAALILDALELPDDVPLRWLAGEQGTRSRTRRSKKNDSNKA